MDNSSYIAVMNGLAVNVSSHTSKPGIKSGKVEETSRESGQQVVRDRRGISDSQGGARVTSRTSPRSRTVSRNLQNSMAPGTQISSKTSHSSNVVNSHKRGVVGSLDRSELQIPLMSDVDQERAIQNVERGGRPGSNTQPVGILIHRRWIVGPRLGNGAFGDIYICCDLETNQLVAVKVEQQHQDKLQQVVLRSEALVQRQQQPYWCVSRFREAAPDKHVEIQLLSQSLLGCSLAKLRKSFPDSRVSPFASLHILAQALNILHCLHIEGFVHRDIKSANFCLGLTADTYPSTSSSITSLLQQNNKPLPFIQPNNEHLHPLLHAQIDCKLQRTLYVIDFGLVREYKDGKGVLVPERNALIGFRGTPKYASPFVHEGAEQCARDDLYSVLYTVLELVMGSLPWSQVQDKEDVGKMKKSMHVRDQLRPLYDRAVLEDEYLYLFRKRQEGQEQSLDEQESLRKLTSSFKTQPIDYMSSSRGEGLLAGVGLFSLSGVDSSGKRSGLWVVYCLQKYMFRVASVIIYEDVPNYMSLITLTGEAIKMLRQAPYAALDWEASDARAPQIQLERVAPQLQRDITQVESRGTILTPLLRDVVQRSSTKSQLYPQTVAPKELYNVVVPSEQGDVALHIRQPHQHQRQLQQAREDRRRQSKESEELHSAQLRVGAWGVQPDNRLLVSFSTCPKYSIFLETWTQYQQGSSVQNLRRKGISEQSVQLALARARAHADGRGKQQLDLTDSNNRRIAVRIEALRRAHECATRQEQSKKLVILLDEECVELQYLLDSASIVVDTCTKQYNHAQHVFKELETQETNQQRFKLDHGNGTSTGTQPDMSVVVDVDMNNNSFNVSNAHAHQNPQTPVVPLLDNLSRNTDIEGMGSVLMRPFRRILRKYEKQRDVSMNLRDTVSMRLDMYDTLVALSHREIKVASRTEYELKKRAQQSVPGSYTVSTNTVNTSTTITNSAASTPTATIVSTIIPPVTTTTTMLPNNDKTSGSSHRVLSNVKMEMSYTGLVTPRNTNNNGNNTSNNNNNNNNNIPTTTTSITEHKNITLIPNMNTNNNNRHINTTNTSTSTTTTTNNNLPKVAMPLGKLDVQVLKPHKEEQSQHSIQHDLSKLALDKMTTPNTPHTNNEDITEEEDYTTDEDLEEDLDEDTEEDTDEEEDVEFPEEILSARKAGKNLDLSEGQDVFPSILPNQIQTAIFPTGLYTFPDTTSTNNNDDVDVTVRSNMDASTMNVNVIPMTSRKQMGGSNHSENSEGEEADFALSSTQHVLPPRRLHSTKYLHVLNEATNEPDISSTAQEKMQYVDEDDSILSSTKPLVHQTRNMMHAENNASFLEPSQYDYAQNDSQLMKFDPSFMGNQGHLHDVSHIPPNALHSAGLGEMDISKQDVSMAGSNQNNRQDSCDTDDEEDGFDELPSTLQLNSSKLTKRLSVHTNNNVDDNTSNNSNNYSMSRVNPTPPTGPNPMRSRPLSAPSQKSRRFFRAPMKAIAVVENTLVKPTTTIVPQPSPPSTGKNPRYMKESPRSTGSKDFAISPNNVGNPSMLDIIPQTTEQYPLISSRASTPSPRMRLPKLPVQQSSPVIEEECVTTTPTEVQTNTPSKKKKDKALHFIPVIPISSEVVQPTTKQTVVHPVTANSASTINTHMPTVVPPPLPPRPSKLHQISVPTTKIKSNLVTNPYQLGLENANQSTVLTSPLRTSNNNNKPALPSIPPRPKQWPPAHSTIL